MTIRIALAGTGNIAGVHTRAIHSQSDAEPVAVVTTKADGAAAFRQEHRIPKAYATVEDLLRNEKLDALVVCTPNALHAPQAQAALEHGVAVLVEKPMALNATLGESMLRTAQANGSVLMVGHCWRFESEVLWLKEQLRSHPLGQVVRTKSYSTHVGWGPSGWFVDPALAGGGALADMGIHAIDTTRFLLDDPRPDSVYARIGTYYTSSEVDDTGVLMVNWENGVTSYIETGWWQPHSDGVESSVQLYGKLGFASVFPTRLEVREPADQKARVIDPGFPFPRTDHGPQSMYNNQMAHFLDCVRNQTTPSPGGLEGWINMRITDAAYESSRSGEVVYL